MFSTPPRSLAIVNFTGLRANWGCQSTSWELLKFLISTFPSEKLPEVILVPLLPRSDIDRIVDQTQLSDIYAAILTVCASGAESDQALLFLEKLCVARYGEFAEQVRRADVVVFQTEGTMAGTDFLRGARLLLLPFIAKHAWGKPVLAMNQTIFSCDDRFSEVLCAALNTFEFVSVREAISFDAAKRLGINRVYHIPDTAFLTEPIYDERLPAVEDGTCFAVAGSAYFSPSANQCLFEAADAIRNATGLYPLIAASTVADRTLVALAERRWKPSDYAVVPPGVGYNAAAWALQRCRFVVGGRYHTAIKAAAVGVPLVLVRGNTYKNEGLAAMLDLDLTVRDPADFDGIVEDAVRLSAEAATDKGDLDIRLNPVYGALSDARTWLSNLWIGKEAQPPPSLEIPPGRAISSLEHMEPYRRATIDQARTFKYPKTKGDGLGPKPSAGAILSCLMPAALNGDPVAVATARQVIASYAPLAKSGTPRRAETLKRLDSIERMLPHKNAGDAVPVASRASRFWTDVWPHPPKR